MGLDNYPDPSPCELLEETGKLKLERDEYSDPECQVTECRFTRLPTGCWISGKVFNDYVYECCGESLYEDKTREQLDSLLNPLKSITSEPMLMKRRS